MSNMNGKVVIVTGAGGGLGRSHALMFAAAGAKVVVNDLGGSRDGSGEGTAMADRVVAEIRAAGGEAVPNYDSVATVEGGASIAKAALDAFGRIDVLVNNAGILRDKSFVKMEEHMWDAVMAVHTKQLFTVTQPVARHMVQRSKEGDPGGAIISTTSLAGLLGNYGQANYATAKAGTAGFTRTLALELRKAGVTVNAIAPVAKTRMTEDIDMVPDDMVPEHVSVMALFLASEAARAVTGRTFGVHGRQIFEYQMGMTPGVTKDDADWTVDEIAEQFDAITHMPSVGQPTDEGAIDAVTIAFGCIPTGLRAASAEGWTATLHWVIAGGTDQTLTISNGACVHSEGLTGTPTCTVKTDKDTVLGMFSGKIDPTKAFMAGKITADDMGQMMKMGSVFDFEAIGTAIAVALEAGGAADPVTDAFQALPFAYQAEAAGDWKAVFHFVITGGTDQTMTVDTGTCRVEPGLVGNPACTIKTDKDTVIGMMGGTIDGTKAFMAGKITADDMGQMMKFASFFRLDEEAAAKAASARGEGPAKPLDAPAEKPVALDLREAIGRRYNSDFVVAEGDDMVAYAEATNDPNPRYLEGRSSAPILSTNIAPPLYPVRLFHPLMFQCVGDPDLSLDMLRLVHGEQDMTWHRPLRPGEIVNLRGVLESVAQKSKGCVVAWRMLGVVDGVTVVEARFSVFVRGQMLPGVEPGAVFGEVPPSGSGRPEGEPTATSAMTVAMDQPARYAAASLDDNPIHLDESVARAAGHPSVILHGLCTMAFAAKGIVDELAGGDAARLRRFAVRFSKPVLPGWELTTRLFETTSREEGIRTFQVETINQDGVPVITNGWAELRA